MTLMILGSSGAFGTALEASARKAGLKAVALNHQALDVCDNKALTEAIDRHRPDVLVNSVALVGINPCEEKPDVAFALHSTAVSNLAKLCSQREITLVQLSTHAVFDGFKEDFYTEEDLPNPTNIYAASKYAGELLAKNTCPRHYVVRLPLMFGPRRNQRAGFADKMISQLKEGKELRVADDKIDSPSYTYDLSKKLLEILADKMPYGVYHLANAGKVSFYDFVVVLAELLRVPAKVLRAKDADFPGLAHKPLRTAMKSINLSPLRAWQEALSDYVSNLADSRANADRMS